MISLAYALLWIFVFSMPWERILVLPGIAIVPRVTGGLALGITLFAVVVSGRLRRWHGFHVAAVLFWIWAGANLLFFHSGVRLPAKFWTYGQLLLVVWMIWELAPSERRLRGLLTAYVFGAYIAAIDTLLIYRTQAAALRRFAAGGGDPNDLAMVLALGVPMAWYLGMTYRQPVLAWVCRVYLPLAVVAIGLTGSRGGMVATTVALLTVPLSMTRLSPGRLAMSMAMLGVAGALAVAYVPDTIVQRLLTIGSELEGGRIGGRGKLWEAGLEAFVHKPVAGYGTGHYRQAIFPILAGASQVAHNSYISVLVEQGIVGFLLYMTMLLSVFRAVLKLPVLERRFAIVVLATLGVAMLPLTWEDRRAVWVVLALLLGFSQARVADTRGAARQPLPPESVPVTARPRTRRALGRPAVPHLNDAQDVRA
ncbi:MAG: O-antigen ligase family protein [Gemmatimonadales bacterium]|nr:O-antigen ligase family protein [Gemmatimonadales bacterium]MBA3553157.1 O-antigen ligase family protein [Gemmatimonadales bacterium]